MASQPKRVQGTEQRDSENGPSVELALVWQVGFEKLCLAKPGSVRVCQ